MKDEYIFQPNLSGPILFHSSFDLTILHLKNKAEINSSVKLQNVALNNST
jgi:hypothetical protein